MEKKDRELLLQDLCARLPYKVKVLIPELRQDIAILIGVDDTSFIVKYNKSTVYCPFGVDIKPYLRPMSSMTEEEEIEYDATFATIKIADGHYDSTMTYNSFDFLNAHHFDFRNLIEKGIAIEVTEKNNPYKE